MLLTVRTMLVSQIHQSNCNRDILRTGNEDSSMWWQGIQDELWKKPQVAETVIKYYLRPLAGWYIALSTLIYNRKWVSTVQGSPVRLQSSVTQSQQKTSRVSQQQNSSSLNAAVRRKRSFKLGRRPQRPNPLPKTPRNSINQVRFHERATRKTRRF